MAGRGAAHRVSIVTIILVTNKNNIFIDNQYDYKSISNKSKNNANNDWFQFSVEVLGSG